MELKGRTYLDYWRILFGPYFLSPISVARHRASSANEISSDPLFDIVGLVISGRTL
jgi:hypothetical protein